MSTTETETRRALIHDDQIVAINAARTALAEIAKANHTGFDTQASGMVYALADVAGDALFQLLNWYDSHAGAELTYEQVHNRAKS